MGFITTFLRGTEWAATGKVTQKIPADFPGAEQAVRPPLQAEAGGVENRFDAGAQNSAFPGAV